MSSISARRRGIAAFGAIVVVAGLIAASAGIGAGGSSVAEDPAATTTTVELTGAARELGEVLEKDRQATFHARYSATSSESPGTEIVIETWRKPPLVRQDTELRTGDEVIRTRAYLLGERAVRCGQVADAAWSCKSQPAGPEDHDPLLGGVREQLATAQVTARDDEIDGRTVRCFRLVTRERTSELCATAEGVPVRVRSGESRLILLELDRDVTDADFEPPASDA